MVRVAYPTLPSPDRREILRYAGCREESKELTPLLDRVIDRCHAVPAVCYDEYPITVEQHEVIFPFGRLTSRDLAEHLAGCDRAVLFAATVGLDFDRVIRRLTAESPAMAVIAQGYGAERIESLCDAFEEDIKAKYGTVRPRFSPGYGDLPMEAQRDIFAQLTPEKHIGLSMTQHLLMVPTKSVTAIIGIKHMKDTQ